MNARQVSRYFKTLTIFFREPCEIILTGAAAGAIYGRVRASLDIDFALRFKTRSAFQKEKLWQRFELAVKQTSQATGIAAQYAEDIDRWSSITFLDYWNHTKVFKRFGKIEVKLLDPSYWAIGKFTRYLDPDIRDLIEVLKKTNTPWKELANVLGRALKKSPKSTACFLFRRQVENFLSAYGRQIWGASFNNQNATKVFHQSAGIKVSQ